MAKTKAAAPNSVEPVTGTKLEKKQVTQEEWDAMDNLDVVPHNPPVSIPVYEGTGRNRKQVGGEDYFFRVHGIIYHATESLAHQQTFEMFEAEITDYHREKQKIHVLPLGEFT